MTRINCGIPSADLTDQHLIAELRELPRIPNAVKKKIREGNPIGEIPKEFCLGTGHVRFFYDKLSYLHTRYNELLDELKKRGFKCEPYYDLFHMLFSDGRYHDDKFICQYGGYSPTDRDRELIKERIATRIRESKQIPRYYGKPICKEYYIKNILNYEN